MENNRVGQPDFGQTLGDTEWKSSGMFGDVYPEDGRIYEAEPDAYGLGEPGGWTLESEMDYIASPTTSGEGLAPGDVLVFSGWRMGATPIIGLLDGLNYGGTDDNEPGAFSFEIEVPAGYGPKSNNGPQLAASEGDDGELPIFQAPDIRLLSDVIVPDPDPDPGDGDGDDDGEPVPDAGWQDLAQKTAAFLGQPNDEILIQQAKIHVEIVTGYVAGFTRGRGFDADGMPNQQLRLVIVSATARLSNNPDQVTYYQTADYTERPAVLAGWTLPELAILHNFRRRWA